MSRLGDWILRGAVSAARVWTRIYTLRLPPDLRDARRAEIDSDLWESQQDPRPGQLDPSLQLLGRLLLGMPDDLRWRIEQASTYRTRKPTLIAVAAALLLITAAAIFDSLRTPALPRAAAIPMPAPLRMTAPPPPPPPPRPGERPDRNYWSSALAGR